MLLYIILFIFLLFSGVPIVFSLLFSTIVYTSFFTDYDMILIPFKMQDGVHSFTYSALPFFLLVGELMTRGEVTQKLIDLSNEIVGYIKGGLANVSIATGVFMATISGAATADAAALGSILIPAMEKDGYHKGFAASVTSSAAIIGPIIPPSIYMIVFAALANVSVGRLFLGGVIPGLLMGITSIIIIFFIANKRGYGGSKKSFDLFETFRVLGRTFYILFIPLVIMGGIVSGIFTATESGVVAVYMVIVMGIRHLRWKHIVESIMRVVQIMGSVMIIVGAATVFGFLVNVKGMGDVFGEYLMSISSNPLIIMLLISIFLLIMGCFIEGLAMIMIMTPILIQIALKLGFDLVHFGVVMILSVTIGIVTPPVGLVMFIATSIADVSIEEFAKQFIPFLLSAIFILIIIIFVPKLVLYVPNMLMPIP